MITVIGCCSGGNGGGGEIGDGVVPITSALRRSAETVSVVYAGWWPLCTVLTSRKAEGNSHAFRDINQILYRKIKTF